MGKEYKTTSAIKPHAKLVRGLAFAFEDARLVTASDDATLMVIDVNQEKIINPLEGHKLGVSAVCHHPSSPNLIISSSFDKSIKLWDLRMN